MAYGPRYRVPLRRRKEGRTNYRKRKALLLSRKPRLVVRRSNNQIRVQVVTYDQIGDKVAITTLSNELANFGWSSSGKSIPAAYLTGYLAGKRALAAGYDVAVLDIGTATPHIGGRLFSALKGAVDAGLDIPHGDEAIPSDDRVTGKHIDEKIPGLVEKVKNQIDTLKDTGKKSSPKPTSKASKED